MPWQRPPREQRPAPAPAPAAPPTPRAGVGRAWRTGWAAAAAGAQWAEKRGSRRRLSTRPSLQDRQAHAAAGPPTPAPGITPQLGMGARPAELQSRRGPEQGADTRPLCRHPVRSVSAPCRPRRDPGRAGVASRGAHSHASSCSATSSVLGALPPPSLGRPAGMGTVSALTALGAAQWRADQEPEGHQTIKHEQCFIYRSGLIETKRPELASPPPAASPEQSKVREGL